MRIYRSVNSQPGDVQVFDAAGKLLHRLDPRLDLANHSPTGFAWGYNGSGPSQLALAILADFLRWHNSGAETPDREAKRAAEAEAVRLYMRFKFCAVNRKPQGERFEMTADEVEKYLRDLKREDELQAREVSRKVDSFESIGSAASRVAARMPKPTKGKRS